VFGGIDEGLQIPIFTSIAFALAPFFPPPFGGLVLMSAWHPGEQWVGGQWFLASPTHPRAPLPLAGDYEQVGFRFGYGTADRPLTAFSSAGAWHDLARLELAPLVPTRFSSLGWLVGGVTAVHPCSLDGVFFPQHAGGDWDRFGVNASYRGVDAHVNESGLSADGEAFVRAAMRRGMLIGMDHFSQQAREDVLQLARRFGDEAHGAGAALDDYPVFAEHTHLRGWDQAGPVPLELRESFGFGSEVQRTATEVAHVGRQGGVVAPIVRSSGIVPPTLWDQAPDPAADPNRVLRNDCDYSSKTWAIHYLEMARLMGGAGVAASTDFNPTPTPNSSRYGWANPRGRACHAIKDANSLVPDPDDGLLRALWPRDTATDACMDNGMPTEMLPAGAWSAGCPGTQMVTAQINEWSGVVYDRYAAKPMQPEDPNRRSVLARGADELREDSAARAPVDEWVQVQRAGTDTRRMHQQMYPLVQFSNFEGQPVPNTDKSKSGWDYNLDGVTHMGMVPDLFQDVRNVGVTFEQLEPLFRSAADLLESWERACRTGNAWAVANGEAELCR
jgi:hypothetical protein